MGWTITDVTPLVEGVSILRRLFKPNLMTKGRTKSNLISVRIFQMNCLNVLSRDHVKQKSIRNAVPKMKTKKRVNNVRGRNMNFHNIEAKISSGQVREGFSA